MEINISKLFSMFNTSDDNEIVSVKVGDLKRLINEKNNAINKETEAVNTIRNLQNIEQTLRNELADLDRALNEAAKIRREHLDMENKLKELEEKLILANSLMEVKNARIAMDELEKPVLVNLYG